MLTMMIAMLASGMSPAPVTIRKVASDGPAGPSYLMVSGGDLDGDGLADEAVIRFTCANDAIAAAHAVITPRDAGSGIATGKRMHKPITITKEWEAASARVAAIRPTYDVKTVKGARVAADPDGWQPVDLDAPGLCSALGRAVKTRSNIQNN